MVTFEKTVYKRFERLTQRYKEGSTKILEEIENYNPSSIPIDLCSSFQENELQPFANINPDKFTFDCRKEYKNSEKYPIKRLCALNGNEFMVTMKNRNSLNGFVRFYHVDDINYKESFSAK